MYSPGKAFVVYEIRRQVLPTAPSPTTTHFIGYKSVKTKFKKHPQKRRSEAHLHFETLLFVSKSQKQISLDHNFVSACSFIQ